MKLKPVWEDNLEEWSLKTGGSLMVFPNQKRNEWGVEKTNSLGIVEGEPSYFPTKKDAVKFAKEWFKREEK